ncbi:protein kinase domain-containing protein [Fibrivirga algicola]|uniref:Protein kinase n=1 Tax=Fibrivirga algicola TaxID=2950420 RepID=A0ABX0QMH4_9BACT|nr:protein kinase [Fibrivirga algicola]NID13519.1 protein kinase [Fibrivirga algicola]
MATPIDRLQAYIKNSNYKIILSLGEVVIEKTPIGQGGNGVVYAASIDGNEVALKFLVSNETGESKKRKTKRFLSEYYNVVTLSNTNNIIRYINYENLTISDSNEDISVPVIIMKRYKGSLAGSKTSKSLEEFIKIFKFLISTVKNIHNSGIIHRDIKPENILLDEFGFVLTDFGIASYNPELFAIRAITKKSERLGNRVFSAPEQENGGIHAAVTMDIYAIGQVLQWYATGSTHRGTGRTKVEDVFAETSLYDKIIDKCLEQDPRRRFQSIKEIEAFIEIQKEKPYFTYLSLFSSVCRRSFPRNDFGIVHSNEQLKIDRLFNNLLEKISNFDDKLWFLSDTIYYDAFSLKSQGKSSWKFDDDEFTISDVWVHYNSSEYNDFILVRFKQSEPFLVNGVEQYETCIVDDIHHISHSEYHNKMADINGEIWELSEHKSEKIIRSEESGYFFLCTEFHCVFQDENRSVIDNFLIDKKTDGQIPTIEEISIIKEKTKRNIDLEVRSRL